MIGIDNVLYQQQVTPPVFDAIVDLRPQNCDWDAIDNRLLERTHVKQQNNSVGCHVSRVSLKVELQHVEPAAEEEIFE